MRIHLPGPSGFTIGDAETAAASLTLSKGSSNPALVPTNKHRLLGGSASNRNCGPSLQPPTKNGTATITVNVSDGQYTATATFVLTVNAVNDPPTISTIANQSINVDTSTVLSALPSVMSIRPSAAHCKLELVQSDPCPFKQYCLGGQRGQSDCHSHSSRRADRDSQDHRQRK